MSTKWGNCFKSSFKQSHPSLELVPRSSNNSDSRVYPRSQQFDSGLGVQKFSGQDQFEIESSYFQTITGVVGSLQCRPICRQDKLPTEEVFQLETKLTCKIVRCFHSRLEDDKKICLSSVLPDRSMYVKNSGGAIRNLDHNSDMAVSVVIPSAPTNVSGCSSSDPHESENSPISDQGGTSSVTKQNLTISRMEGIGRSYQAMGLSVSYKPSPWVMEKGYLKCLQQ